jgi:4-hydroxy-2-oxoheptanedioate aldolase
MSGPTGAGTAGEWLRRLHAEGGRAHGLWCSLPASYCAELVAACSPDFLVIDCQHGFFDQRDIVAGLQAVSRYPVYPLIRVAQCDPHLIGAALDAGAAGVIVPLIEDRETAQAAVAACRYGPDGRRSYGPGRSALLTPGSPRQVNAAVTCVALIETAAGVERADQICSVPGIDAVMVGAADLAIDLGLPAGSSEEVLRNALARVATAAAGADLPLMIGAADERPEHRATLIVVATDSGVLRTGVLAALERARSRKQQTQRARAADS